MIVITVPQMERLRHREVLHLAWSHTANTWRSENSATGSLDPESLPG